MTTSERTQPRRRRVVAAWLAASLLASGLVATGMTAGAETTMSPSTAGAGSPGGIALVRDASLTLNVGTQANSYQRATASLFASGGASTLGAYAAANPSSTSSTLACTGTSSPYSEITVTGPGGFAFSAQSPVKTGVFAGGNQAWRGSPWSAAVDLNGKPAGVYTVTTTIHHKVFNTHISLPNAAPYSLACVEGVPTAAGLANFALGTTPHIPTPNDPAKFRYTPGPVVETTKFEYRPWQVQKFNDLLGKGKVRFNASPAEFQFSVADKISPVISGSSAMTFYNSPESLLVAGPGGDCTTDPASCLPSTAIQCTPGTVGCNPRLVTINHQAGSDQLVGVFDLGTGAFAALASTGGTTRVLASAGPDLDPVVRDALAPLNAALVSQGIDLIKLLNQRTLATIGGQTLEISLLQGLEIRNALADELPDGLRILNDRGELLDTSQLAPDLSVAAGIVQHNVTYTGNILECLGGVGTSGITKKIATSSLVPSLPADFPILTTGLSLLAFGLAGAALPPEVTGITGTGVVLGGGPFTSYQLDYPDGRGSHQAGHAKVPLLGTGAGPNVDLGSGGLIVPGLTPDVVIPDQGPMHFLGYVAFDLDLKCLGGHNFLGTGLATYGDLPVDPYGIPLIWDTNNPVINQLNAQLQTLVGDSVVQATGLLGDPTVAAVLAAVLGLAGGTDAPVSLDEITALLGGDADFVSLITSIVEDGPGSVDGLAETLASLGVALPELPADLGAVTGLLTGVLGLLGL
jgi:hypothetical protein